MAGIVINEITVKSDVEIVTTEDGNVAVPVPRYHAVTMDLLVFGADSGATAAMFVEQALRSAIQAVEDAAEPEQ